MGYRSISTVTTPAIPLAIPAPAGIQNDDILILWVVVDDQNVISYTPPAGFTAFSGFPLQLNSSGGTDGGGMWAGYKKAASESGSYSITNSGSDTMNGGIVCISGCDPSAFLHRSSIGTNNTANASPWTMTTAAFSSNTSATCTFVYLGMSDNKPSGTVTHAAPSGMTKQADVSDGTFSNSFCATQDSVASGETGARSAVGTGGGLASGWACVCIALASTGGGSTVGRLVGGTLCGGVLVGGLLIGS